MIIVLAALGGFLAGFLGAIVGRASLFNNLYLPYLSRELNLSGLNPGQSNFVIQDPKKVVVNSDLQITETLAGLRPSLVGIFKKLPASTFDAVRPAYYQLSESLFAGLVMTADGWVAAPVADALKKDFNAKNYVAITADRQVYELDQIVEAKNSPANLLLFHLAGAVNLPVRKIIPRTDLSLGESLLLVNGLNQVRPTTLASFSKTPAVLSSDALSARLSLADTGAAWNNSFLFDLSGNLAGFITSSGVAVPAFAYNSYWQGLLSQNKVALPFLGVSYLDLSVNRVAGLNMNKGALISAPGPGQAAVVKNSPAAAAGLKAGDIITWVNNQEVNGTNDLADIVATFRPGDTLTLAYRRDNQDKEVDLKLGELK